MAKKPGAELPANLKNKTVTGVKSSTSIIEELTKEEIVKEESNVLEKDKNIGVSLSSILGDKKRKKEEKAKTMIYLEQHLMNQIKTVAMDNNLSVTSLVEMSLKELFEHQEVDMNLVEQYDDVNKRKGERKTKKRTTKK